MNGTAPQGMGRPSRYSPKLVREILHKKHLPIFGELLASQKTTSLPGGGLVGPSLVKSRILSIRSERRLRVQASFKKRKGTVWRDSLLRWAPPQMKSNFADFFSLLFHPPSPFSRSFIAFPPSSTASSDKLDRTAQKII